jgi:hypothetical protein
MPDFFLNGGDDFKSIRTWYTPRDLKIGKDIRSIVK